MLKEDIYAKLNGKNPDYYVVSKDGSIVAKRCTATNRWLPISEFYKAKDGCYSSKCKAVLSSYSKLKRQAKNEAERDDLELRAGLITLEQYGQRAINRQLIIENSLPNVGYSSKKEFIDANKHLWGTSSFSSNGDEDLCAQGACTALL